MIKRITVEPNPDDRRPASILIIDFTDGYRAAHEIPHHLGRLGIVRTLRSFATFIGRCKPELGDSWIKHDGSKPIDGGRYWVMSSYGVRLAGHHDWGDCFQDETTGCDEGMRDMRGKEFEVSHYIPIVEPEPPKECAE